jgi:hypothetical protein
LRLGLKVVTYPGKCKRRGTSLPCCAARGRRLAVRIGQVIEKATVLKVKGLGGEQSAKERGRASRR